MKHVHCQFIRSSELLSNFKRLKNVLDAQSSNANFTWGDCNHSLITIRRLHDFLDVVIDSRQLDRQLKN